MPAKHVVKEKVGLAAGALRPADILVYDLHGNGMHAIAVTSVRRNTSFTVGSAHRHHTREHKARKVQAIAHHPVNMAAVDGISSLRWSMGAD
eukprot:CAMPEP_0117658212 /NCGR_PEP_ID=MMETSP0804-20121206/5745_1 /TAXON_ID=1074897 /ORGANISM="Tetraselmis astigmatica, Strain CCMP880" /LENGTH=91 /DNA_ID=CAMNT_0005464721 /DNA_START=433 /DNA_END=709 /DNA_ORIENTATION=-